METRTVECDVRAGDDDAGAPCHFHLVELAGIRVVSVSATERDRRAGRYARALGRDVADDRAPAVAIVG